MCRKIVPFVRVGIIVLLIVTHIPVITMFLPQYMH